MDQARRTDRPVLNLAEVAGLLGVDYRGVSRACTDGSLPSVRIGRRVLVPRKPFLALLGEQSADDVDRAA
ncbi:helix-turn-helix domain-containing protein [Occultella kanbiaonis]|uniref:helix-turn-helix domain-containing protein n=1 Tax=Occultella kanbiaonis TaxID=2675754 RepID=UPI0039A5EAB8